MAKPLKCRVRMHDWADRVNSETQEHYEVCLRCDAYREKGQVAPGAAAGGTGPAGGFSGGTFGGFG